MLLAERGQLRAERGDVVLFANTSAEHPGTYRFARACKQKLERDFGLPFFWFEFCTVEDAVQGTYTRRPSYRLVRPVPIEDDPRGYHSRGEVFEEMLSYQGMLPNPHNRSCTAKLKLHPSHQLLAEWLGRTAGPAHAGHYGRHSLVSLEDALMNYRRRRGRAPRSEYFRRLQYMSGRPPNRTAQHWCDYTDVPVPETAPAAVPAQLWGRKAARHVTLLGLRADEQKRIERVYARCLFAEGAGSARCAVRNQPPGERPSFPLADWGYDDDRVRRFWRRQPFDLNVPKNAGNCVFCFMKGTLALDAAARQPDADRVAGSPSDVAWWHRVENRYAREVPARDGNGTSRFGFFGVRGPSFREIAGGLGKERTRYSRGVPACDCTD